MNETLDKGRPMPPPRLSVEIAEKLKGADVTDLCDAAEAAIKAEGGFGWLKPPSREVMERYWRGVLVVPERTLFVARLDGVIAGSVQLVRPPRNNEAQAMGVHFNTAFMAPWARGHGLARMLLEAAEALAQKEGFAIANMDVRDTQDKAIALCEALNYTLWGTHPRYAQVNGEFVRGHFYFKHLTGTVQTK
jgi:ribosomal protein S18 acetylase RimI-like enzyme